MFGFMYGGSPYKFKITRLPVLTMFPWSPDEFKTRSVILEARASLLRTSIRQVGGADRYEGPFFFLDLGRF